jgi:hypothetical protein
MQKRDARALWSVLWKAVEMASNWGRMPPEATEVVESRRSAGEDRISP